MLCLDVEILLRAGDTDKALDSTADLARQFPLSPLVQRAYAATAYRTGDVELAIELLRNALLTFPEDTGLLDALMTIHYEQKSYQAAATAASKLSKIVPEHSKAYRVIGDAQLMSGQATEAHDSYRQALRTSNAFETVEGIYLFAREAGQLSLIRNLLKSWSVDHPSDTRAILIMAADNQASGEHQEAIEAYKRVIAANPDDATALNDLAWVYHIAGHDEALSLAERAYAINPTSPNILDTLGWILTEHGDFGRAIPMLTEATKMLPHVGDVQYHLAQALANGGHFTRAWGALTSALQSNNLSAREAAMALMIELKANPGGAIKEDISTTN